jgi:predicted phosphodiesterase
MSEGDIISFIHLSDIHFNKYSGDPYDMDADLRNEIANDIGENAKAELINIQGIFVCGDIAFAGQRSEYKSVLGFLNKICRDIEIPESMVFSVPGNHDVDHNICKNSPILLNTQKGIEDSASTNDSIDRTIADYSHDSAASNILYSHLANYNEFASKFNCQINVDSPTWHQYIPINNYKLRIQGMNSTLISSHLDHKEKGVERLMVVGRGQIPPRQQKTINISLCHHPPDCWKDPDKGTLNLMNQRCQIQLYGHKHTSAFHQDANSLIIGSGAMQPPRSEFNWVPSYNWITLEIVQNDDTSSLKVKIFPRKYCYETHSVIPNNSECDDENMYSQYMLKINQSDYSDDKLLNRDASSGGLFMENYSKNNDNIKDFISLKTLVYNYMSLSLINRIKILLNFNLIENTNDLKSFDDVKKLDEIFDKIVEGDLIDKFKQEIEACSNK